MLRSVSRIASTSRVPCSVRYYAAAVASSSTPPSKPAAPKVQSSCKAGTVLKGLSVLKDKPDPVALPDEEYPAWLWTILESGKQSASAAGAGADKKGNRKGRKAAAVLQAEMDEQAAREKQEDQGPARFDFVQERKKLRAANRASIKAANFLKTT